MAIVDNGAKRFAGRSDEEEGAEPMALRSQIVAVGLCLGLLGLMPMATGGNALAARDATPTPETMQPVGNCVKALGIGEEGNACVNVIHASPDAPAVDIYVNGEKALADLAFGQASGWVALPAGEHRIQVTPAGAPADEAVIDATVELEAGGGYEIVAVGLVSAIEPRLYPVNVSELDDQNARVRVIHTSPDAPEVDVAVKDGDVLIAALAFPDASEYLTVPAGSYDLEVRVAGTNDVALELPGVQLEAGMAYSVYAIGQVADQTLTVLPIVASTEGAMMATPTP